MKNLILLTTISSVVHTLALQKMMRATLILLPMFLLSVQVSAQEKLEVEGAIIVGNSEDPSPAPGTIRFNGATNDFEGWNGQWVSFSNTSGPTGSGMVTDIDGNQYLTVTIGQQTWMRENLRTTRYRDGDLIPEVLLSSDWAGLKTGAWTWYDHDPEKDVPYGKLYNWYAVNDASGLCPTGWHIPTDSEWTTLTDLLGGESVAGGAFKTTGTIEAGTGYWRDPNTGANNGSGFTGLPGGGRTAFTGSFLSFGASGNWWSSTEFSGSNAWRRYLESTTDDVNRGDDDKRLGLSVRCIKD